MNAGIKMNGEEGIPILLRTNGKGQFLDVVVGISVAESLLDAMEEVLTVNKTRDPLVRRFVHSNFPADKNNPDWLFQNCVEEHFGDLYQNQ